jgi:hypothetical protein
MVDGSGLLDDLSGPWFEERQDLTLEYTRVPVGSLSSHDIRLDQASEALTVNQTYLLCHVTANYSRKKTYYNHSTSSFQQPQKFEVLAASSDHNGINYGPLSTSTLGPAGSIVTYQPWYYRRYWDANNDNQLTQSCDGYTFVMRSTVADSSGVFDFSSLQGEYMQDFTRTLIRAGFPGSVIGKFLSEIEVAHQQYVYSLGGTFSTSQESFLKIIQTLDILGNKVENEDYYKGPPNLNSSSYPVRDEGCDQYDISRHNYT